MYDPFDSVLSDESIVSVVTPITDIADTTTSVSGKLFGLDEAFVIGIVVGVLALNFISVLEG